MRAVDLIRKKRDGHPLSRPEIEAFVTGATDGSWPDYQLSALLMATVLSFVPPFSNFVMMLRMASATPPPMWQAWVSIVIAAGGGEVGMNPQEKRDRNHTLVQQALNHPLIADAIEIFNGKLVDVQILPEVNK